MQDLLKEEEFIKPPYNPWRWFRIFYGIALVEIAITYYFSTYNDMVLIGVFLIPLVTPLAMFFCNKKNSSVSSNSFSFASLILFAIYFAGIFLIKLINNPKRFFDLDTVEEMFAISLILLLYYAISYSIILVHLKIKRDIQKVKAAESK